jgi:hypothetical protein
VLELHGTTHEVVCMSCGRLSCRHELQNTLADLNPEFAALAARLARRDPESTKFEKALKIGTAADARAMRGGEHEAAPLQSWQTVELGLQRGDEAAASASASALHTRIERMRPSLATPAEQQQRRGVESGAGEDGDTSTSSSPVGMQRPDGDVELSAHLAKTFRVPSCSSCGSGPLKPHVVFFGDNLPPERKDRVAGMVDDCDGMLVVGSSLMVFSAFRLAQQAQQAGKPLVILTVGETRADPIATHKLQYIAGETLSRLAMHPSLQLPASAYASL